MKELESNKLGAGKQSCRVILFPLFEHNVAILFVFLRMCSSINSWATSCGLKVRGCREYIPPAICPLEHMNF
jgi:hypothetical protein